MTWTERFARLGSTMFLLVLVSVAAAQAQDEEGIIIQLQPIPLSVVSPNALTLTYVPLDDIGTALGAKVEYDASQNRYTIQPGKSGVLELNTEAGIVIEDQPVPQADRLRVNPTSGVMRRPRPQPVDTSLPETRSFAIGDKLVSRGIIIINSRPYMPLADLGAAMGATVSPDGDGGRPALIPQRGAVPLLGLSERGIIIIDN